jgi:hypothetical protein
MPSVTYLIGLERIAIATVSGSNVRWSDAQLTTLTDRAVKWVVGQVFFPESRVFFTTQGMQEYQLPELHTIKRVYANGQLVVPSNLETLSGNQILLYDQTGQGLAQPGIGPTAAPPGAGGFAQPQYSITTPVSAPYLNAWGIPAPLTQPYSPGQRPRYYPRSGAIGFVPALGPGAIVTVDCVLVPTLPDDPGDNLVVPDQFVDAIVWKVCDYTSFSDNDDRAGAKNMIATQKSMNEIRTLRTWVRQVAIDVEQYPMTFRGSYKIGGHRAGY